MLCLLSRLKTSLGCMWERKRAGWIMFKNDKCWHLCYNLFTPNASHYLWSLTRCLFLHLHFFLMENCSYKTLYNPKARSVAKDWSSSTRVTWGLLKTNGNFQFSKLAFCSNEAQQFFCAAAGIRQGYGGIRRLLPLIRIGKAWFKNHIWQFHTST